MKAFFIIPLLAIIIGCYSCDDDKGDLLSKNERVTGSGSVETDVLYLEKFEAIDLEGVANVYVVTGKKQKVSFTAYENILHYMEASVVGDELLIRFRGDVSINSDEEIRVEIGMEYLDKITLSGVGNFYIEGPHQETLKIELNGVGNIEAYELPVYEAFVEINGTGNVQVLAKDRLEVDIDGLGNVYYLGSPELDLDISGLGEVVSD